MTTGQSNALALQPVPGRAVMAGAWRSVMPTKLPARCGRAAVRALMGALAICSAGCAGFPAAASPEEPGSAAAATQPQAVSAEELESDRDAALYQIYIDSDGQLIDPGSRKAIPALGVREVRSKSEEEMDEDQYVERIFDNMRRHKGKELTVFIHGGLNTFESATQRVKRFKDTMLAENKYPLFVSWDAGWPGNYSDHLFFIRRGVQNRALGVVSSPVVLVEDVARSVIRLPASTYNVVLGHRFTGKEERAVDRSRDAMTAEGKIQLHLPSQAEEDAAPRIATWSDPKWWNPTKLVVAPLIDGFGTGAWDSMLRRTDLVLRKRRDDDYDPEKVPGTAASKFFRRLEKERSQPGVAIEKREPVTLVGHSMGTIIANNIISKYQQINFSRIIYMAAACRVKDLDYVVAPYMLRNKDAHFYNLSLHPQRDISESQGKDFAPRGSLLMWIDQTLGDVNSFQDRTAGYWRNIARSAPGIFEDDGQAKRVHLTVFGMAGPGPLQHGDFGQFRFWRKDFWTRSDCTALTDTESRPCFEPAAATTASLR